LFPDSEKGGQGKGERGNGKEKEEGEEELPQVFKRVNLFVWFCYAWR
jgi:hypothetical protein